MASVNIKVPSTVRAQANMWNVLNAMAGNGELPTCDDCGGITVEEGPTKGRCTCNAKPEPAGEGAGK